MTANESQWVTKAEIATHLKCSTRYVNKLMRRGILPYLKTRGLLRFDPGECERALEVFKTRSRFSRETKSQPPAPLLLSSFGLTPPHPSLPSARIQDESPSVVAKMFSSPEQARQYLDELIGRESAKTPTVVGPVNKKAPITVIILQSAPVI